MLGLWGSYMPFGTGGALLLGPAVMAWGGWPLWWWVVAAASLAMAAWLWTAVPPELDQRSSASADAGRGRIRRTLRAGGPWLVAIAFGAYSAQWLAVIGFLPTIYQQAGLPAAYAAVATALAAGINLVGNIAAGRLLQRGVAAPVLIVAGFAAMAAGAIIAFAPWSAGHSTGELLARYAGVLLFSTVGGLVPGTLFSVGVRLAPDDSTVSTTIGWMQQWSSIGQFVGPPLAALVAAGSGGWDNTWWVTVSFAAAGMLLAVVIGRALQKQVHRQGNRAVKS
jgi:predicted MFS family arabinose efflux permease